MGKPSFTSLSRAIFVLSATRQERSSQQDFPRQTIPDDPQDLLSHLWLQPIESQNHLFLRPDNFSQSLIVGQGHRQQFIIAVYKIADSPPSRSLFPVLERQSRFGGHCDVLDISMPHCGAIKSNPNSCSGTAHEPSLSGRYT